VAFPSTTIIEVRSDGNDENGGAFDPVLGGFQGGTDHTQRATPHTSVADLGSTGAGSPFVTSSNAFDATHPGNAIYIVSGTNFVPGWYLINMRIPNMLWLERSPTPAGIGSGGVANIGGAFASVGWLSKFINDTLSGNLNVSGMSAWVRSGTYSITAGATLPNGTFSALNARRFTLRGYDTVRGDNPPIGGNQPYFVTSGSGGLPSAVFRTRGVFGKQVYSNLKIDAGGNNDRVVSGDVNNLRDTFEECELLNGDVNMTDDLSLVNCSLRGDPSGVFVDNARILDNCELITTGTRTTAMVVSNDYVIDQYYTISRCLIVGNSNTTSGFSGDNVYNLRDMTIINCGTGIELTDSESSVVDCLVKDCSVVGYNMPIDSTLVRCAGFNNGVHSSGGVIPIAFIACASDPLEADYTLNSVVDGGVLLQGVSPEQASVLEPNRDLGATQRAGGAGGGVNFIQTRRNSMIGR